eukprot:6186351-Pleurochrysis_carterae.AAC.4
MLLVPALPALPFCRACSSSSLAHVLILFPMARLCFVPRIRLYALCGLQHCSCSHSGHSNAPMTSLPDRLPLSQPML